MSTTLAIGIAAFVLPFIIVHYILNKKQEDKSKKGFIRALFGKQEITDEHRKEIAAIFKPLLEYIKYLKPIAQIFSGASFAFAISAYFLNNFTSLPYELTLGISTLLGVVSGILVEGGLSAGLTPFWKALITNRFQSRIYTLLFLGTMILVIGFGSITTLGSYLAAPEIVDVVTDKTDNQGIDISSFTASTLAPIESLVSSQNTTVSNIEKNRKSARKSIIRKWDAKIKADNNWAKKKGIKSFHSSYHAKKERELSIFDDNTAKQLERAASQNTKSIESLSSSASSTLSAVTKAKGIEDAEKKQRKNSYSNILGGLVVFATIATFLFVGIREGINIGGGEYIKDRNDSILDDIDDINKTDDDLDTSVNQSVIQKAKVYIDSVWIVYDDGDMILKDKGKDNISKWFSRGQANDKSDNWIKFLFAKKYFASKGVRLTTEKTRVHFWYNGKEL